MKVRDDGKVTVLDFGLAKSVADASSDDSDTPTVTGAFTSQLGVVLGTVAYMSPEQARGDRTDQRTDIWAFGSVVFEMLTGHRAFDGTTSSDVLAAVLRGDPQWEHLPPDLHPRLRLMLERCLAKSIKDRYHGMGDARFDVEHVLAHPRGEFVTGSGAAPNLRPPLWRWILGTAAVAGVLAAASAWVVKPSPPSDNRRLSFVLPAEQSFSQGRHPVVTVAPDGSAIVYVANNQLFLRPMNDLEARPMRGTEGLPSTPFFSPDGRSVGYWDARDEGLKRIGTEDGTPVVLDRVPIVRGASWGADGTILYATTEGIRAIFSEGGQSRLIIPIKQGMVHGPQMLPDRRAVLFTRLLKEVGQSWEGAQIVVKELDGGPEHVILTGEDGRYVPTGHLVYAVDSTLFAVPFDARSRRVTGGPVPLIERVRREVWVAGNTATANYAFANDGTLVYVHGRAQRFPVILRDLVTVDRKGHSRSIVDQKRDYWRPGMSPDGKRLVVEVFDGSHHLWLVDLATRQSTQLTFEGIDNFPVWTADGRSVVYKSITKDGEGLYRKSIDGRHEAEFLGIRGEVVPTDVSRNGTLVYSLGTQSAERAIWALPLNTGAAREILATPAQEHHAMFSPDGNWIAYASNASGQQEIYVRPFPIVPGTERRVSEGGGSGPVWAANGSALYFRGSSSIMAADVSLGTGFAHRRPRPLFSIEGFRLSGNSSAFDVHRNGDRFIMVTEGDPPSPLPNQINVVVNWFAELKRLVPAP